MTTFNYFRAVPMLVTRVRQKLFLWILGRCTTQVLQGVKFLLSTHQEVSRKHLVGVQNQLPMDHNTSKC